MRIPLRFPNRFVAAGAVALSTLLASALAHANGALCHIHISQLAYEALPDGPIRTLLDDPAMMEACERGSMFPDSGYAADDAYGEFAHWEPFYEPYMQYIRAEHAGDFSSPEAKEKVAFALGMMSHSIADQVYDTTLLARSFEVDGPEPEDISVDQFADYFAVIDHGVAPEPTAGGPFPSLAAVMSEEMDRPDFDESILQNGMDLMAIGIRAQVHLLAKGSYLTAWENFPFLGMHIYNPDAVGSLPWLGKLVAAYWQSVWVRIHDTDQPDTHMIVRTIPENDGYNWPIDDSESVAYSRVGIVFGYGVKASETFPLITLKDPSGNEVPVEFGSPYGGENRSFLFLRPEQALEYDTEYTVTIAPGVTSLGGEVTTEPYSFSFRTRCDDDHLDDCPPLAPPLVTGDIPDALPDPDVDADAGTGAGAEGDADDGDSGCGCRLGHQNPPDAAWLVMLGLVSAVSLRRRHA